MRIAAVIGLIFRPAARSPLLWLGITALLAVNSGVVWYDLFNHHYLIMYACLAMGVALLTKDPAEVLAGTARVVLGLVFLFAVIYKSISPDFPNGGFFEFSR